MRGERQRERRLRRFVVAEDSMRPTLHPGQQLLAVRARRLRNGQLCVFEHPHRPGFWLVKRVDAVDGDSMVVRSDNVDAPGAVDSRVLGLVPTAGAYRVLVRSPRRHTAHD
ncbi:MAG: S26 family signal peptidase [Actinomycetota bacterium]